MPRASWSRCRLFNTAGKLNNFPHDVTTVASQQPGLDLVKEVDELVALTAQVGPQTAYLSTAEAVLPGDHPWLVEVQQAKADLLTKVTSPSYRADSSFQRGLAQTLGQLKTSYQDAYLELHKRAHLGAKDDEKKAALTTDPRLKQLQKLDAVEIMPHQQLKSFQDTLFGLKTCFALSRQDLDQNPVCPHTGFRPVESPTGALSASEILAGLDDRLDTLVGDWTSTLLANLDDPTVGTNIELISDPAGKDELQAFMDARELPEPVSAAFVKALQEALTGLEKVAVTHADLRGALVEGGIPCTVEELKSRFDSYVAGLTKGQEHKQIKGGGRMSQEKQSTFGFTETEKMTGPVECLGQTFESDDARRDYYLALLAEKLTDPEFRKMPGFPKGTNEAILRLSDPPYYTACPNPFLPDFVRMHGRPYDQSNDDYARTPFAADVSEGRYAPESLAHSYHTKVPARAVARYILHYTDPGDIILDAFCGTGMTGIGAELASGHDSEFRRQIEQQQPEMRWGRRHAILSDLSPAATQIAKNYCAPVDPTRFAASAEKIIDELVNSVRWMFETTHRRGTTTGCGLVNYTIGSDVLRCPHCGHEFTFWAAAVDVESKAIAKQFDCGSCHATLTKGAAERVTTTEYDLELGRVNTRLAQEPILINYTFAGKRYSKTPDEDDFALLDRIEQTASQVRLPTEKMLFRDPPWGDMYRAGYHQGVTHLHHFYTRRNLIALATFAESVCKSDEPTLTMLLTSTSLKLSRMSRFQFDAVGRIQNGVLYLPSLFQEMSPLLLMRVAVRYIGRYQQAVSMERETVAISTGSATDLRVLPDASVDYVFTDPPFGGNIMYSELNFIWESWLGAFTQPEPEAIVNKKQTKAFTDYQQLMRHCFDEYYRVLKPGRWMTVEFHNSQNAVWNAIQEAILQAGFVIGDVRILDKKQKSFKQATTAGAVKQDLIISAYRPQRDLEESFELSPGSEDGAWKFVSSHLAKLPVFIGTSHNADIIGRAP